MFKDWSISMLSVLCGVLPLPPHWSGYVPAVLLLGKLAVVLPLLRNLVS